MNLTLDTTAIVKGIIPPRRKKRDGIFKEQFRVYKIASAIIDEVYQGKYKLFIPTAAIIETAAVTSRITGDESAGRKSADFVKSLATEIINEAYLTEEAISIAVKTKISGFDNVFIACAKVTNSELITDDKKMHTAAIKVGVKSKLLREIV